MKGIDNRKLRRLLAYNEVFTCTDVKIGDTVISYKPQSKKGGPRWRGPALISDIDEPGVTVKFQSQISREARLCVRKKRRLRARRRLSWIP